jgi:hypothetical protein
MVEIDVLDVRSTKGGSIKWISQGSVAIFFKERESNVRDGNHHIYVQVDRRIQDIARFVKQAVGPL